MDSIAIFLGVFASIRCIQLQRELKEIRDVLSSSISNADKLKLTYGGETGKKQQVISILKLVAAMVLLFCVSEYILIPLLK